jgi:hypothetical protein
VKKEYRVEAALLGRSTIYYTGKPETGWTVRIYKSEFTRPSMVKTLMELPQSIKKSNYELVVWMTTCKVISTSHCLLRFVALGLWL